jgi:porphobilinogen synthase
MSHPVFIPPPALDLIRRPRRLRSSAWIRRLVRENVVSVDDLIWPIFIEEGEGITRNPIPTMPGVDRLSIAAAVEAASEAARLGIPVIALFPNTPRALRDEAGSEALNPENLTCRALRAIKRAVPEIGLMTDVALDPYTSHGHDGLLQGETILNDETVAVLCQQALVQAEAGADIIAPSDMMDGRIGAIRAYLDAHGFSQVAIMAYSAKYASSFYGPFRDAVGSSGTLKGDKRSYQMDFSNGDEALSEVELDLGQGADMVMVKPGLPYLDILYRVKNRFLRPTYAYQVSGEYALIMLGEQGGIMDSQNAMIETLTAFKRAGADGILTYFAPRMARYLRQKDGI